jgi:hypothetical protein
MAFKLLLLSFVALATATQYRFIGSTMDFNDANKYVTSSHSSSEDPTDEMWLTAGLEATFPTRQPELESSTCHQTHPTALLWIPYVHFYRFRFFGADVLVFVQGVYSAGRIILADDGRMIFSTCYHLHVASFELSLSC